MAGKQVQIFILLLIGVLTLAACNSGGDSDEDIELPTRVDAVNGGAGENEQQDIVDGATPTAPPTITPGGRPTLPPSWTPTISPTSTVAPTTEASPTQEVRSTPVGCGTFRVDREASTSQFRLGETPTIAWTSVDGASSYRIRLFDEMQLEITLDPLSATGTSLDLNPDFFTSAGRYGWIVEPIDANGIQMCNGLGESFVVSE